MNSRSYKLMRFSDMTLVVSILWTIFIGGKEQHSNTFAQLKNYSVIRSGVEIDVRSLVVQLPFQSDEGKCVFSESELQRIDWRVLEVNQFTRNEQHRECRTCVRTNHGFCFFERPFTELHFLLLPLSSYVLTNTYIQSLKSGNKDNKLI